jgi:CheY-like chemotaxis protein/two-component sensor histidine kinase
MARHNAAPNVEVKTFISAAIETAKPIIASRQHHLQVHLPEHDLWIKGDAVRMTQICGNLLHNAAKFTPPGGNLAIAVEQSQDSVVITVKDNGIGISTENTSAIFGLFSQGEHAPDRVKDGLGIGLSLVKTLIELHGGTVRAVSDGIGTGSSFELRLPITPLTVDYSPQKEVALQGKDSKLRILVVDDNVDSADLLGALLEYEGHEVQTSYNGAGAIECALRFRPDFVFLDIGLPDISGYQVAFRLRQLPQMENAVLVALTGYGQEKDKTLALEAGFNVHLVKPLALDTLRLTIRRKTEPAP